MFPQRHSCDRCRQQKVRCLKNHNLQATVNGDQLAPCERCAKADVPCVYSSRQKNRRTSHHRRSDTRSLQFSSQDLTGVLSQRVPIPGSSSGLLDDMMTMPLLDTTVDTDMPGFDDDVRHHMWNHNLNNLFPIPATLPGPEAGGNANMGDSDINSEASSAGLSRDSGNNNKSSVVDALTKQVMALSTRAMCATRQLDHHADSSTPPLTVNSPVVNEAFEIANALVRIIHGILAANFNSLPASSSLSSSQSSEHESQQPITTDYGLVFLALASHQHVLGLFRAICDSIRWSLGSMAATESDRHQKQALHSNEASSAQFVMVLQLVMHLISRVDRSLRTANWKASSASSEADANGGNFTSMALLSPNLTSSLGFEVGDEGGGGGGSQCVVDLAQNMLRMLPDEHAKIKHVIQRLQKHMEEGF